MLPICIKIRLLADLANTRGPSSCIILDKERPDEQHLRPQWAVRGHRLHP